MSLYNVSDPLTLNPCPFCNAAVEWRRFGMRSIFIDGEHAEGCPLLDISVAHIDTDEDLDFIYQHEVIERATALTAMWNRTTNSAPSPNTAAGGGGTISLRRESHG